MPPTIADERILASAADWLLAEARSASGNGRGRDDAASADGIVDLSAFTVVVPGRGAGHRLIEILLDKTALTGKSGGDRAARGGRLVPPQTVTLGTLPEELYEPAKPLADTATETLCWVVALAAASQRDRQLIAPLPEELAEGDPDPRDRPDPTSPASDATVSRGKLRPGRAGANATHERHGDGPARCERDALARHTQVA